jgi:hypothetical protein
MAKNQTIPIRPVFLQADTTAFAALKAIADYSPNNEDYDVAALENVFTKLKSAQEAEVVAAAALATAHDNRVAAEWEFHNRMLMVKSQVAGQYGDDSNELQSLGRKKKSEYKARKSRKQAAV